jgi:hypothetical protein
MMLEGKTRPLYMGIFESTHFSSFSICRVFFHAELSEECFPVRDPILDYRLHCLCKVRPQVLDTAEHLAEPFPCGCIGTSHLEPMSEEVMCMA